jgi:predicted PurR-regulated permease PerM
VSLPDSFKPGAGGHVSSGPLVWAATITCTTLLLAFLQQTLWFVVPFLLAIILSYALFPVVRRLVVAGVTRETAAAIVVGSFFIGGLVAMVPTASWIAAHAVSGEELLFRYLDAVRVLFERFLSVLESQFRFLERMDLHATLAKKISGAQGSHLQEHAANMLLAITAWLPALLLVPFLAFFLLRDGRRFLKFLVSAVPNAYFERTLDMIERVDVTARAYFQGLLKLTLIDTACLALGLALLGFPGALALGLVCAVLSWVPIIGSVIGCVIVVLVAATDFPAEPWIISAAVALFVSVRLLDDFLFMPLTIGRSLHMHPVPTVLLIFLGGAVAGIPGLILAPPLAGVVMVVAGTVGGIINDPRLRARHAFARILRMRRIGADLKT